MQSKLSFALSLFAFCGVHAAPAFAGDGLGKLWTADNNPGSVADFNRVQFAVDAAQDGDTIQVVGAPSPYAAPVIDGKALTIVRVPGSSFNVHWRGETRITGLAAGQLVALDRIELNGLVGSGLTSVSHPALEIDRCAGDVWISRCSLRGGWSREGALVSASANVVFHASVLVGGDGPSAFPTSDGFGGPGNVALRMHASRVSVYASNVHGGAGGTDVEFSGFPWPCNGGAGGAAARLFQGSELYVLGSKASNGETKGAGELPAAVFAADDNSIVRSSDSAVSTFAICGSFADYAGPHEDWGVPHRQLLVPFPSVLVPGAATLSAQGEPGDLVVLGASAASAALELPGLHGLLLLAAPQFVVGTKLLSTSGMHQFTFPISSPTQPGQYASFCFQAAFVELGGAALLSNPALVKVPL